jgi:hypothetical protein
MLKRRLADTTTKLGIGANRAAVASSMLQKYGTQPGGNRYKCQNWSGYTGRWNAGIKLYFFIDYLYGSIHQYSGLFDPSFKMPNTDTSLR